MITTTQKFPSLLPFSTSGVTENITVEDIHDDDNTLTSATAASLSSSSTLNSIASGRQQTALCATAYRKQQKQLYDNNVEHSTKRRSIYSLGFDSNNTNYLTTPVKPIFKVQQNNLTHTNTSPFFTSTTLTTTPSTFNQQDLDCGSSSGLGGTNNCSSNSSFLDSDSRDSGSGSSSAINKISDIKPTLTPVSIIATAVAPGISTLSSIPLTISNMLPPLQPVLGARSLPQLGVISPLPSHHNANALHLLSTTNFVGSSATSPYSGTRPLNGVIAASTLPLNNTNGKQWPSTSIPPPALSHPAASSPVKPLYTMTCEAAAIAAAAAAAAGYHVR